jgi:quinol monooxygenase YgiN
VTRWRFERNDQPLCFIARICVTPGSEDALFQMLPASHATTRVEAGCLNCVALKIWRDEVN